MEKKKINLDKFALNLNKSENETIHLGQMIAQAMFNSPNEKDALKVQNWCFALFNKEELELDESDLTLFKSTIKKLQLPVWAEAQTLTGL